MRNFNFKETEEYKKDYKKLAKRYESLKGEDNDIERFKNALLRGDSTSKSKKGIIIRQTKATPTTPSVVVVKAYLVCAVLRRKSLRLRLIYGYQEKSEKIEFIELYFKVNKNTRENEQRINKFLDSFLDSLTT